MVYVTSTKHYHIPSTCSTVHRIPSHWPASKVRISRQFGRLSWRHYKLKPHLPTSQTHFLLSSPHFKHPPAYPHPPSTNDFNAVWAATQSWNSSIYATDSLAHLHRSKSAVITPTAPPALLPPGNGAMCTSYTSQRVPYSLPASSTRWPWLTCSAKQCADASDQH